MSLGVHRGFAAAGERGAGQSTVAFPERLVSSMSPHSSVAPRRHRLRAAALITAGAVLSSATVLGGAAAAQAATSNISTKPLTVLLGVGADETSRNLNWYYPSNTPQAVEFEPTSMLAGTAFTADKTVVSASVAANTATDTSTTNADTSGLPGITAQSGYVNAKATISGLQPSTQYSYHVGAADGTNWSDTYSFTTPSTSDDFSFLFFGDPQIGSSGHVDDDAAGWADTLSYATTHTPHAELLVSGGDQIENANNEYEWSAFADSSSVLKQYPWAATIGNHDVGGKGYEQHNNLPNALKTNDFYATPANSSTTSGGDYWYIWKDVLFIDINSNAYAGGADAEHVNYITSVIDRFGDQAKWKVLVYHHSIYSPADHANDADNQQRRADFTRKFSELGVNLVLQGHDHSYSRSYAILNGKKANVAEQPGASEVFAGPGGVIYVTANSSSGSKYYDLTKPDATKSNYGADPLDPTGNRHFANSVENQEHVRTYTQVSVSDSKLDVTTVRASDCTTLNSAVTNNTIGKKTCGVTASTATNGSAYDPAPIGSAVDHFALDKSVPATTTSLSATRSSKVYGSAASVALTAKVAGGLNGPSGTVAFYEGSRLLGTKAVTSGPATVSLTLPGGLAVGKHVYTAKFISASVFTGASSSSGSTVVTVTKATSSTAIGYSHKRVTVVTRVAGVAVSGSVKVYDGKKLIKSVKLSHGTASFAVALKKGKHTLKGVFPTTSTVLGSSATKTVKIAR